MCAVSGRPHTGRSTARRLGIRRKQFMDASGNHERTRNIHWRRYNVPAADIHFPMEAQGNAMLSSLSRDQLSTVHTSQSSDVNSERRLLLDVKNTLNTYQPTSVGLNVPGSILRLQYHPAHFTGDAYFTGRFLAAAGLGWEDLCGNHRVAGVLRLPHHHHGQHACQLWNDSTPQ